MPDQLSRLNVVGQVVKFAGKLPLDLEACLSLLVSASEAWNSLVLGQCCARKGICDQLNVFSRIIASIILTQQLPVDLSCECGVLATESSPARFRENAKTRLESTPR